MVVIHRYQGKTFIHSIRLNSVYVYVTSVTIFRTPGPAFKMADPPRREQLALALAEKAGERHRDRKQKAIQAARKQFAT